MAIQGFGDFEVSGQGSGFWEEFRLLNERMIEPLSRGDASRLQRMYTIRHACELLVKVGIC